MNSFTVSFVLAIEVQFRVEYVTREFTFDFIPVPGIAYEYGEVWECKPEEVIYDIESRKFRCYQKDSLSQYAKFNNLSSEQMIRLLEYTVEEYIAKGWERESE